MAKKIISYLIFVALFIVFSLAITSWYRSIISSSDVIKRNGEFFHNDLSQTEILVLGDSHAAYVLRHFLRRRIANWATPGESYIQYYFKLKYFLARYKPKMVVLPLDLHSFCGLYVISTPDYFWKKYINYFELAAITGNWRDFFPRYYLITLFPFSGRKETILEWLFSHLRQDNGLLRNKPEALQKKANFAQLTQAEKYAFAKWRIAQMFMPQNYCNATVLSFLDRALSLCNRRGIKVLLVKFPVSREYYQCFAALMPIAKYYRRVELVVAKHPQAKVLDLHDLLFDRPECLLDIDHPNFSHGAPIMNQKINEELRHLLPREPHCKRR